MNTLIIPLAIVESIRGQALREMPNEACGYLAGNILADGSFMAVECLPMTNIDASPDHFSLDPKEQFAAVKTVRGRGLQLLAVYHSHPETPARMSDEDIRLANDTETVYVIYSVAKDDIKGFTIDRDKVVSPFPVKLKE